jgi:hypothetical protein
MNPKRRVKSQGYTQFEIIEEHLDKHFASHREIELQKQYGYIIDSVKYNQIDYVSNGKKGGCKNTNKQQKARSIVGSKYGKIYGIQNKLNGNFDIARQISWNNGSLQKAVKAAAEKRSLPMIAINLKTNEEFRFNSIREGSRFLNLNQGNVQRILKGERKSIHGYTFKYA